MTVWHPGVQVEIETDRFLVRSLTKADATPVYVSWWNDAELQASLEFPPRGWGRQHAERHIGRFDNRTRFHLGIFPKGATLPIGFITIFCEGDERARTNILIGDKDYWGKRVVIEVRARVMDFLFDELGIVKVCGIVDGRNIPSIFNYKALGFTCEGILRQHKVGLDGSRHDQLWFGLMKEDWQKMRK